MPTRKDLANALRMLAVDAVERANSGHPGAPMGMANMAEALWRKQLKHNPKNPNWANRDRFVLSNGHASMLMYGLLHLTGYELSIEDIKNFRQLHSKTPGHPEIETAGIETTTGPLGQGIAMAVGMAIAEKKLANDFNRTGHEIVNHNTYCFVGDGCLMEGLSQEAISLAGQLKLDKLIVLYDDNNISIDGEVSAWFSEDTKARFEASAWHVIPNIDGHDSEALDAAISLAKTTDKPTLICCKTTIGFGSPKKAGTNSCHGSPLGKDEIIATRQALGWNHEPFVIPQDIYDEWNNIAKGQEFEDVWNSKFSKYAEVFPELALEFKRRMNCELPKDFDTISSKVVEEFKATEDKIATRALSGNFLSKIAEHLPELFGGSADLTSSVNTWHKHSVKLTVDNFSGNYISYGVREFAMACIMNGMALHGGFLPYGGTFLVFSDYMRSAIRLSAIMKQRVVYVLTHDSIGVGEDGPTHEPVEHTPSLRLIPDLKVWRPADAFETSCAWVDALKTNGPTALILSRQGLPQMHFGVSADDISKGGYIAYNNSSDLDLILISTGSELHLAKEACAKLEQEGRKVRIVSMPCVENFEAQSKEYKEQVLPKNVRARIAIEATNTDMWYKYVGLDGVAIGMNSFGLSAPANELFNYFGINVDAIIKSAKEILA